MNIENPSSSCLLIQFSLSGVILNLLKNSLLLIKKIKIRKQLDHLQCHTMPDIPRWSDVLKDLTTLEEDQWQ